MNLKRAADERKLYVSGGVGQWIKFLCACMYVAPVFVHMCFARMLVFVYMQMHVAPVFV
jgi:hypothetical protein